MGRGSNSKAPLVYNTGRHGNARTSRSFVASTRSPSARDKTTILSGSLLQHHLAAPQSCGTLVHSRLSLSSAVVKLSICSPFKSERPDWTWTGHSQYRNAGRLTIRCWYDQQMSFGLNSLASTSVVLLFSPLPGLAKWSPKTDTQKIAGATCQCYTSPFRQSQMKGPRDSSPQDLGGNAKTETHRKPSVSLKERCACVGLSAKASMSRAPCFRKLGLSFNESMAMYSERCALLAGYADLWTPPEGRRFASPLASLYRRSSSMSLNNGQVTTPLRITAVSSIPLQQGDQKSGNLPRDSCVENSHCAWNCGRDRISYQAILSCLTSS